MQNYYTDFPHYISNSTLGTFYDALYCVEDRCDNLAYIFAFGSLVDAMITEREKLDFKRYWLYDDGLNEWLKFDYFDWKRAEDMAAAALLDPTIKLILNGAQFQYIYLRKSFEYEYNGQTIIMPTRCKFDILNKRFGLAADIKTTACTTQESFVASISHFKYYRQAAVYMDLAKVDKMWYFGIGKKKGKNGKYPIFKFAISRGDDIYNKGKYQYGKLGYLYKHMIYDLDIDNLMIAA